ncbi:unnamed protein product [Notodromas monacha]|uniref:Serine/threonine-protein kinase 40 n=1 Tax=Notodromas monacha TaxID=399045 RepID=A0A7R9BLS0_9CRUS|nr:unnamed protein product [Notodromas monacha]CAG0916751.1 unnamed protein product [Notodromas monacha]
MKRSRMSEQAKFGEKKCKFDQKDEFITTFLDVSVPPAGTRVNPRDVRRAGPFLLGPTVGNSPVTSIVQRLARRAGTDEYFCLKILSLKNPGEEETQDYRQGKMLMHTEYSLLSLLEGEEGVVKCYGLFKYVTPEIDEVSQGYTGRLQKKLSLVLERCTAADPGSRNPELVNLQQYVIKEKRLGEQETLQIFYDVARTVRRLHQKNIVHRDLKLGNLVLNKHTYRVTITNFCLGKHLLSDRDLLRDQRGSPAYISPDVLSGKPYCGKPSDMWALGVVLYTMLYGRFPFYDSEPLELFRKIKTVDYTLPMDGRVSRNTHSLISRLLTADPKNRLTADQLEDALENVIGMWRNLAAHELSSRLVPECPSALMDENSSGSSGNGEVPVSASPSGADDDEKNGETAVARAVQGSWTRVETFQSPADGDVRIREVGDTIPLLADTGSSVTPGNGSSSGVAGNPRPPVQPLLDRIQQSWPVSLSRTESEPHVLSTEQLSAYRDLVAAVASDPRMLGSPGQNLVSNGSAAPPASNPAASGGMINGAILSVSYPPGAPPTATLRFRTSQGNLIDARATTDRNATGTPQPRRASRPAPLSLVHPTQPPSSAPPTPTPPLSSTPLVPDSHVFFPPTAANESASGGAATQSSPRVSTPSRRQHGSRRANSSSGSVRSPTVPQHIQRQLSLLASQKNIVPKHGACGGGGSSSSGGSSGSASSGGGGGGGGAGTSGSSALENFRSEMIGILRGKKMSRLSVFAIIGVFLTLNIACQAVPVFPGVHNPFAGWFEGDTEQEQASSVTTTTTTTAASPGERLPMLSVLHSRFMEKLNQVERKNSVPFQPEEIEPVPEFTDDGERSRIDLNEEENQAKRKQIVFPNHNITLPRLYQLYWSLRQEGKTLKEHFEGAPNVPEVYGTIGRDGKRKYSAEDIASVVKAAQDMFPAQKDTTDSASFGKDVGNSKGRVMETKEQKHVFPSESVDESRRNDVPNEGFFIRGLPPTVVSKNPTAAKPVKSAVPDQMSPGNIADFNPRNPSTLLERDRAQPQLNASPEPEMKLPESVYRQLADADREEAGHASYAEVHLSGRLNPGNKNAVLDETFTANIQPDFKTAANDLGSAVKQEITRIYEETLTKGDRDGLENAWKRAQGFADDLGSLIQEQSRALYTKTASTLENTGFVDRFSKIYDVAKENVADYLDNLEQTIRNLPQ